MDIEKSINIGKRNEQQDSLDFFQDSVKSFLVVADGMGGHKGGEMASTTLIEESKKHFETFKDIKIEDVEEFFQTIVENTTQSLKQKVEAHEGYIDPHTTVAFALIQEHSVFVGNIGDSRVYIFEDGEFKQRSKDHSVVEYLFDIGRIREKDMATHPDQNKLLRSINAKERSEISFFKRELKDENFAVLVCSDGFWEGVSKEEMIKNLFSQKELKISLDEMVSIALKNGGERCDNISVVACVSLKNFVQKSMLSKIDEKIGEMFKSLRKKWF